MSFQRFHKRHKQEPEDLDVTPLLNLLIILLPVLLVGLVFTRTAILQVEVPALAKPTDSKAVPLTLGIAISQHGMTVKNGERVIADIGRASTGEYDYARLSAVMQQLKQTHPDAERATIMLQPDTPYDVLVHCMDAVRVVKLPDPANPDRSIRKTLFPQISLGDAPRDG